MVEKTRAGTGEEREGGEGGDGGGRELREVMGKRTEREGLYRRLRREEADIADRTGVLDGVTRSGRTRQ